MAIRLSVLVLLLASARAFAAQAPPENFSTYYLVHEAPALSRESGFEEPFGMVSWRAVANAVYDLMNLEFHDEALPAAPERYNRDRHFGKWIRDGAGCLDTRGKVLVRDSAVPVGYSSSGCTVQTGEWHEPYEGKVATRASEIQIDHFVPLKNAYISGAGRWDSKQRCLYANYMGNDFHLIPVDGRANMNKGDQTPATWMPRHRAYRCEYLRNWLRIKLIWGLALGAPEARAVRELASREGCDAASFRWPARELDEQRRFIEDHADLCD